MKTDDILIEDAIMRATNLMLTREIDHIKDLVSRMREEFRFHRPVGKLVEVGREFIKYDEGESIGGSIHLVRYEDDRGNSFLGTEGYAEDGSIVLRSFFFGFAVYNLVKYWNYYGKKKPPDNFLKLLDRHPKFLGFILEEFSLLQN